ncbi:MAG TPA: hypothetical protein VNY07_02115 [Chthoniobacterales bacterium]|nr:hypothetical protein [Chthoniobacterales bacterium]
MKKGCLIAVTAGLVLVVIIILLAFGLTRGAVKAGDQFLGLIGSGKIASAYESASPTLKSQQTLQSFEQAVKNLGLADFASASWSSRETNNGRAHLEGSVTTRSGGNIPLTMELVKELGTWKVISLSAPQAGVSVEQGGKQLPSDEKSKALALDSLLAFNKAVQDKSFVGFHQQISRRWQEQITPDKLKEVFNQFIETHLDISPIKEVQPILSAAPEINSDGILVLEGYYPTSPTKVYFRLKYIYEHPAWKLFGIQVNVE